MGEQSSETWYPYSAVFRWTIPLLLVAACGAPCPPLRYPNAAAALSGFEAGREPVQRMRAELSVERFGENGRVRGTVLMFAMVPNRLRFDVMGDLVGRVATLTSDGARFALWDENEGRFLVGDSCAENVGRLVGIPLSGREVTEMLLGDAPQLANGEQSMQCDDGQYFVAVHQGEELVQELWLDVPSEDFEKPPEEQTLRIRRVRRYGQGALRWTADYDDYRALNDAQGLSIWMPRRLRFREPQRGTDTTVRFRRMDLNIEVPDEVFQQESPGGVAAEEVLCPSP